jgi:glycosyltransferase involved in cell wall biosynthesis
VNENPLVSIVTPSWNTAPYLPEMLECIAGQSYPHIEHIVMDGGSTDGTIEILKRFEGKYNLRWVSEKDRGQADAINKGMRLAKGDIITYLNADDLYYPETVRRVVDHFARHPDCKALFGRCTIIDGQGAPIKDYLDVATLSNLSMEERKHPTFETLLRRNSGAIPQPSAFWKREVMDEIGLFDESFHYTMDYEYWLRISRKYPFGFIDEPLSAFRMHEASKTGSLVAHRFWKEAVRAARMHGGSAFSGVSWVFAKMFLGAPFRASAWRNLWGMVCGK